MPESTHSQIPRFFVFIVESPSASDLYHGTNESNLLQQAIKLLDETECVVRMAISREAFHAALIYGLSEEMRLRPESIPILHISAHGGEDGFATSIGEVVTWDELKGLLIPINKALGDCLILCMSCCEGWSACSMAMKEDTAPFYAMIGHSGSPTWADTAVAYAAFYHRLAKGAYLSDAVEGMKAASGEDEFYVITAQQARDAHLAGLQRLQNPIDFNAFEQQLREIKSTFLSAKNLEGG